MDGQIRRKEDEVNGEEKNVLIWWRRKAHLSKPTARSFFGMKPALNREEEEREMK